MAPRFGICQRGECILKHIHAWTNTIHTERSTHVHLNTSAAIHKGMETDTHTKLISPPQSCTNYNWNFNITLPLFQCTPMGDEKTNDWGNRHAASTARRFMPGEHANSYVKEIQLIQPWRSGGKGWLTEIKLKSELGGAESVGWIMLVLTGSYRNECCGCSCSCSHFRHILKGFCPVKTTFINNITKL